MTASIKWVRNLGPRGRVARGPSSSHGRDSRWRRRRYPVGFGRDRQVSPLRSRVPSLLSTLHSLGGAEMPTDDPFPGVRRYRQRVGNHNLHAGAAIVSSSTNDKIFELGNHGMLPSL